MDSFSKIKLTTMIYATLLLISGYISAKLISNRLDKLFSKRFSKHQAMLTNRISFYFIFILFLIAALQQLGFNLSVLLGAAGVFTVALSFASKTAASNLVSGIFLLFEHPFKVGDTIGLKNFTGTVKIIDLLSTKIITPDNRLVRIPNENLIKSEIINYSCLSTRRADIIIGVGYETNLEQAQSLLIDIASNIEYALKEPKAKTSIINLGDSAIEIRLSVWANNSELSSLKSKLQQEIQQRFSAQKIDIPYPQITIHKS